MSELSDEEYDGLVELLKDAEICARLTQWEEEFLADIRERVMTYEEDTRISDKQWQVLRRIEGKVYG